MTTATGILDKLQTKANPSPFGFQVCPLDCGGCYPRAGRRQRLKAIAAVEWFSREYSGLCCAELRKAVAAGHLAYGMGDRKETGVSESNVEREKAVWASSSGSTESWQEGLRLTATALGLCLMLIGFYFAMRLFGEIYSGLKQPERFAPMIVSWERVVGGKDLDVTVAGQKYPVARLSAIVILGGGCWALVHVAIGLVWAGARIVSWTATDRLAIKRIILQALGKPDNIDTGNS
jgi:hypothetical protein